MIRHVQDYGAILLFDSRYNSIQSHISPWLRKNINIPGKYRSLELFFDTMIKKGFKARVEQLDQVEVDLFEEVEGKMPEKTIVKNLRK